MSLWRDALLNYIESWNVVELMNRNCCFADGRCQLHLGTDRDWAEP